MVKLVLGQAAKSKLPELFLKACESFLKGTYKVSKAVTEGTVNTARRAAGEKGVGHKTLSRLTKGDDPLERKTIASEELRGSLGFERTAKKYGINYELVENKGSTPPTWEMFFKKKDMPLVEKVLAEHAYNQLSKGKQKSKKPTFEVFIRKYTKAFENLAQQPKEKSRSKGGIEH